jgi:hypothetical protein
MSSKLPEDPKEIIEMRKSLAEFGRVVRKARQSNQRLPRVEVHTKNEREEETTKKIGLSVAR